VNRLEAYSNLERLGPVVSTAEAAAGLRLSVSSTSRLLRGLADVGRAHQVRSGIWALGQDPPDPFSVISELTRPHLSYVSFSSALNYHGMIDQIPREVSVASLDRARRIETSLGVYGIHHLPAELFGGWQETPRGRMATPEKAIFDLSYVSAVHQGGPRRVPEIELPAGFNRKLVDAWVDRIASRRLATITRLAIDYTVARATSTAVDLDPDGD
jgi:predicted transcriptional regulator of viral defense system